MKNLQKDNNSNAKIKNKNEDLRNNLQTLHRNSSNLAEKNILSSLSGGKNCVSIENNLKDKKSKNYKIK